MNDPRRLLGMFRPGIIAYNGYDSGLGNRVRVVLGAQSLASLEGRAFAYVWPTGKLFGPRFSELWDFSAPVVPRAFSRGIAPLFPYVDETLEWLDDATRRQPLWQIRTGSPIRLPAEAESWQERFRALRPTAQIADRVERIFDEQLRGRPYIGVMIRAHSVSHAKTLQASPVEWFLARLREIRRSDPDALFFVSCDTPDVQSAVLEAVPGCVAQHDKGPYNSTEGVLSSIVDLYLLAASGYLIGPHFSSFVHLAEHLAGDQLTFETALDGCHGPVDYHRVGLVADPLRPVIREQMRSLQ
ncbi:hypothetical protein FVA74_02110 [Salinibacterium sp. dk2585]|uniref:hypothetical protein n=1 Tax=unclassified Salinibacterium TaxID=2632331 RepID=UPI0011C25353|nr:MULTISPECIES: hypothetical protein [unclassified Salinibacterium]QEE60498.1 hypothetical protein FVA74_02110 [Salinibacterium sp. dk2585]TXK55570.1 hypothetical protein FVP63_02255 [Salinibacterium sp. dk5596]